MTSIKQRLARGELVRVMFQGTLASPNLVKIAAKMADVHEIWFD